MFFVVFFQNERRRSVSISMTSREIQGQGPQGSSRELFEKRATVQRTVAASSELFEEKSNGANNFFTLVYVR